MEELNKFEVSILERLASRYPAMKNHIPFLKVSSREKTGVGLYINFEYSNENDLLDLKIPDSAISS